MKNVLIGVGVPSVVVVLVYGAWWLRVFTPKYIEAVRLERGVRHCHDVMADAMVLCDRWIETIKRRDEDAWHAIRIEVSAWHLLGRGSIAGILAFEVDRLKQEHLAPAVNLEWPGHETEIDNIRQLNDWCMKMARACETRWRLLWVPRTG